MKLSVALAVILSLSSLVVPGQVASIKNEDLTNALAVHEADIGESDVYETSNITDICRNESLILNFANSLTMNKNFIVSPSIRCISVKIGDVTIREGAFDMVPSLRYLDLRGNNISPQNLFSFGKLPNVKVLRLGNQNYRYQDNLVVTAEYPELVHLELQNAGINDIRIRSDNAFPKLTYLDLSVNRFRLSSLNSLPDTLMHLNVSANQISDFSLNARSNLLSLSLDNNMIQLISENHSGLNLKGLQNLLHLSVANNRISSITRGAFEDTVNLRYLDLSKNLVSYLEYETLRSLTSLEILILDENSLTDIPILSGLNLTELSLTCNNLTFVTSKSFAYTPRLRKLYLSGNTITEVYVNAFQNLNLLEELYLDNNRLTNLPSGWCDSMTNLRYLDLSGNKFATLESAIYSPKLSIEELYFERNPLPYINASTLRVIPKDIMIYLNIGSESNTDYCKHSGSKKFPSWEPIWQPGWDATPTQTPMWEYTSNSYWTETTRYPWS